MSARLCGQQCIQCLAHELARLLAVVNLVNQAMQELCKKVDRIEHVRSLQPSSEALVSGWMRVFDRSSRSSRAAGAPPVLIALCCVCGCWRGQAARARASLETGSLTRPCATTARAVPDEACCVAGVVWKVIAGRGVLGRLAFATERAIPLCPMSSCQVRFLPMQLCRAFWGQ